MHAVSEICKIICNYYNKQENTTNIITPAKQNNISAELNLSLPLNCSSSLTRSLK